MIPQRPLLIWPNAICTFNGEKRALKARQPGGRNKAQPN
jgi:hypothetical protein